MTRGTTIENSQALETILKKEIDHSSKSLRIFAGHLPLLYKEVNGERSASLDVEWWGAFSNYTFAFGAKLLRYALDTGKKGKLMILVDDDVELLSFENGKNKLNDKSWKKKQRKKVRKESKLPASYLHVLEKYDLNASHLVKQHFKSYDTFLISEKNLKKEAKEYNLLAPNDCSLAYNGLLFNSKSVYFNAAEDYHISFLPGQCKGNICEGIIDSPRNIDASYVFFPPLEDIGGLVPDKIGYQKSLQRDPMSISQCFESDAVSYIKTNEINGYK